MYNKGKDGPLFYGDGLTIFPRQAIVFCVSLSMLTGSIFLPTYCDRALFPIGASISVLIRVTHSETFDGVWRIRRFGVRAMKSTLGIELLGGIWDSLDVGLISRFDQVVVDSLLPPNYHCMLLEDRAGRANRKLLAGYLNCSQKER